MKNPNNLWKEKQSLKGEKYFKISFTVSATARNSDLRILYLENNNILRNMLDISAKSSWMWGLKKSTGVFLCYYYAGTQSNAINI